MFQIGFQLKYFKWNNSIFQQTSSIEIFKNNSNSKIKFNQNTLVLIILYQI